MGKCKPVIKMENISKRQRSKQLLEPFNYQLGKGEILALCGSNGAGKSTLIRLITGLIKPTSGRVVINGLTKKQDKKGFSNQFGYMPDDFQFHQSLTVEETILFYANIKKVSKVRVEVTLKELGLYKRRKEKVANLSKGMNQRLLLAQALLAEPKLLILDEPTNGLDPFWVNNFCTLMVNAKKNGQSVIFSTHDLSVVEQIADEIVFLKDGEIVKAGRLTGSQENDLSVEFLQLYSGTS